jgi:hypothetical protein
MFNSVPLLVLSSAAGSCPSATAADRSCEIATRLAAVGANAAAVDSSASPAADFMNTTIADESGRMPSPMRANCCPLRGCSR